MPRAALEHLLHRECIESIPVFGRTIAARLDARAAGVSAAPATAHAHLTVALRTLNEAGALERFFEDLARLERGREMEVIVVDNESSDRTPEVAKHFGATVVTLARNAFTYPRSMNMAMAAASHAAVFMTVGHARLSNDQTFKFDRSRMASAGGRVAGLFSSVLPDANASRLERVAGMGNRLTLVPARARKASMGILAGTNAVIDKGVWKELGGFDERYESGGEDTALARAMLEAGYEVSSEPLLAVHHSHGLGFRNYLRQVKRWQRSLRGPQQLDRGELARSRPDLNLSE
jgi:glycosyltransferase involved in cell wall biosynthesis